MRSRSWSAWLATGDLAASLLALHLIVWRPARALCTKHVAYLLLSSVETERTGNFEHTNEVPCVSIFVSLALT